MCNLLILTHLLLMNLIYKPCMTYVFDKKSSRLTLVVRQKYVLFVEDVNILWITNWRGLLLMRLKRMICNLFIKPIVPSAEIINTFCLYKLLDTWGEGLVLVVLVLHA